MLCLLTGVTVIAELAVVVRAEGRPQHRTRVHPPRSQKRGVEPKNVGASEEDISSRPRPGCPTRGLLVACCRQSCAWRIAKREFHYCLDELEKIREAVSIESREPAQSLRQEKCSVKPEEAGKADGLPLFQGARRIDAELMAKS